MGHTVRAEKKLLFVTPTGDMKAGGEISNLELIKAARSRGYEIHVVMPVDGGLGQSLKELGISYSVIAYGWWMEEADAATDSLNLKGTGKIYDLIEGMGIDCVITNTLNVPWAAFAAALADKPHVWIAREFPVEEFSYLENRYDYIKGLSNLVIANSKNLAEFMRNELDVPTEYFYSFVDTTGLELGSPSKSPRLVSVGHIYPRKNQLELVKAVATLKNSGASVPQVLFIGQKFDKLYYEKIRRFIKRHGIEENIVFAAYNQRPFGLVGPNDIYVQTSSSESIGRTVTEAMKLGLICVGSDIPGVKEAFGLGGGTLYKSGDPDSLAETISNILSDMENPKKRALQAQKRALANMSEEACHDPFFKGLEKVFTETNPRRELRQLAPYIEGAVKETSKLTEDLAAGQVHIRNLETQLEDLRASRAYKTSVRIRKLLKRR